MGRRVGRGAGPVLGLALLAACGGDRAEDLAATSSVLRRDSAGIEIIESLEPAWAEGEAWRIDPDPVLQIGEIDGEQPYLFRQISYALETPSGDFVLVDSRYIRVFDARGRFLAGFGGPGEGPGSFASDPRIAVAPPDTVLAWDGRLLRLTRFLTDGTRVQEESLSRVPTPGASLSIEPGASWGLATDGTLLMVAMQIEGGGPIAEGVTYMQSVLGVIPAADRTVAAVGTFRSFESAMRGQSGFNNLFHRRLYFGLDPTGTEVVIAHSGPWEIRVFDRRAVLRRIARLAVPRVALTDEIIDADMERRATARGASGAEAAARRQIIEMLTIPDSLNGIASLRVDEDRNVWAERETLPGTDPSPLHEVIAPDGSWLGTVEIDRALGNILSIGKEHVLTEWHDELDVPYLRVYRIVKPAD